MSLRALPGIGALLALAAVSTGTVAACSDDTSAPAGPSSDSGRRDGSAASDDGDAGSKSTCEITRAYFEGCGNAGELNCGADGFDAWCAANDTTINSATYRRAEALCLTQDNCDGKKRRACEYAHYNDEPPTASQKALVESYCATCEPSDVAGCTSRSTAYDPAKGIDSVDDIFVAAWELSDDVTDEIKTKCTGAAAADAGADAAACAKAFANCAADVYLDRLPDCSN